MNRKHASEDLQPYTCYLTGCRRDNPLFNTFDAWKVHVLSKEHQQFEGWTCLFCQFHTNSLQEADFLNHIQDTHSYDIAGEPVEDFADICRRYTSQPLSICPVCSTTEQEWRAGKRIDPDFEREAQTFIEHIGGCMHRFALRVLPDPNPTKEGEDSGQNPTTASSIDDRSWPSGYLHVSHHSDSGIIEAELESATDGGRRDRITDVLRLQAWCESGENVFDANSSEQDLARDDSAASTSVSYLSGVPLGPLDRLRAANRSRQIRNRVTSALRRSHEYHVRFLPDSEIRKLVDADAVSLELTRSQKTQVSTRTPDSYCKILAVLYLMDLSTKIRLFVTEGLSDKDLPFCTFKNPQQDDKEVGLHSIQDPYGPSVFFKKPENAEDFVRNQWSVLAFHFTRPEGEEAPHYLIRTEEILPFESHRFVKKRDDAEIFCTKIFPEYHHWDWNKEEVGFACPKLKYAVLKWTVRQQQQADVQRVCSQDPAVGCKG